LFVIQPIIGKVVTAKYGGGAQIWCLSLLFFQFILFFGYSFSTILCRQKSIVQLICFVVIAVISFFFSEIPWGNEWLPSSYETPTADLFIYYTIFLGVPCLLLSSVSTMLQKWYHSSGHGDPYYLYSISNSGSLLCLVAYPFLIEPFLSIPDSLSLWSMVFKFNGLLLIGCAFMAYSFKNERDEKDKSLNIESMTRVDFSWWIGCSAIGTMLLVSITQHVTADMAPIPLLWIVPLVIYLLSFILNFRTKSSYTEQKRPYYIFASQIIILYLFYNFSIGPFSIILYLFLLLLLTIVVHGELYIRKPHPEQLPIFYLMISFGGMLGSFIVNIIYPLIFNFNIDYKITFGIFIIFSFLVLSVEKTKIFSKSRIDNLYRLFCVLLCIGSFVSPLGKREIVHRSRNFYGSVLVEKQNLKDYGEYLTLIHGNTVHGAQFKNKMKVLEATTYYHRNSPISLVFKKLQKNKNLRIGAIGMGVGTISSYLRKSDHLKFYELDPKIVDIAKSHFSFLSNAKGSVDIKVGDGRVVLEREVNQKFDMLFVDAFNSDVVPVHLLTEEAFKVYGKHLKRKGLLVFHVSSRYLSLQSITSKMASFVGLNSIHLKTSAKEKYQTPTYYSLLSKEDNLIQEVRGLMEIDQFKNVIEIDVSDHRKLKPWTDSYSNIFSILLPIFK